MVPAVAIMPLGVFVAWTPSAVLAVILICVVMFGHMAWKTNLVTMTNDIYPTRVVGALSGIVGLGSGFGGMLFTFAAGRIIDGMSYGVVFVIMGFLHPIALLIVLWLVRGPIGALPMADLPAARVAVERS